MAKTMTKSISVSAPDLDLREIAREVAATNDEIILEENGEAVAIVVPVEDYRAWKKQQARARFFETLREISERINMDPEEADALAEEAVRWARAQGRAGSDSANEE